MKETIQNYSKYKCTYYQNTHTIIKIPTPYKTHTYTHPHITKSMHIRTHTLQNPHIHTHTHTLQNTNIHTHTHTHILQNKLKQPQYKIHIKRNSHNTIKYPQ